MKMLYNHSTKIAYKSLKYWTYKHKDSNVKNLEVFTES